MEYRIEKDTMGGLEVPQDKYWGVQTERSFENFKIDEEKMPGEIIRAFAYLKKAEAVTAYNFPQPVRFLSDSLASFNDNCVSGMEPAPKE